MRETLSGKAAQAGAERDDDEGAVELRQRLHLGQQAQPGAEHHHAGAHEDLGAEAVEQPAEHRPEQRHPSAERGGAGERGLAPVLLLGEHGEVGAERLRDQAGLQELARPRRPTMYQP